MAIGNLSMAAEPGRWELLSAVLFGLGVIVFASIVVANLIVAAGSPEAKPWNRRDLHLALVLFTATAARGVLGERAASIVGPALFAFAVLAVTAWAVAVWGFHTCSAARALRLEVLGGQRLVAAGGGGAPIPFDPGELHHRSLCTVD